MESSVSDRKEMSRKITKQDANNYGAYKLACSPRSFKFLNTDSNTFI